jgi:hypothetical protein
MIGRQTCKNRTEESVNDSRARSSSLRWWGVSFVQLLGSLQNMSRRGQRSLFSQLSEERLGRGSQNEDMAWHDELPLSRSGQRESSFRAPSAGSGSHVSLGNNRLSAPFNRTRIAVVALIITLIILLVISCTTLAILVQERNKNENEMQYIRAVLDENFPADRASIHDDPPVQNTAPVAFFQNGTNPPTASPIEVSLTPSAEPQIESVVPTEVPVPPTASPTASPPTGTPTSSPTISQTETPVEQTEVPTVSPTEDKQAPVAPVAAEDPMAAPVVEDPTSVPVPTATPTANEQAPVAPVVDCIEDYALFVQCVSDNSDLCVDCDTTLPGDLKAEEDCDNFNTWFENNVQCCSGDECASQLDALAICKDCPQSFPSAPFGSPIAPFSAPVAEDPTPSPVEGEMPAPIAEDPTPSPVEGETPAPIAEDPTSSPVEGETPAPIAEDPTSSPVEGETSAPIAEDPTSSPVEGETPAPIAEDPTSSPVEGETAAPIAEDPTSSPVEGETPSPVAEPSSAWSQIGQNLTWTNAATDDAASIAILRDGTTAAVGQFENGISDSFGGQVSVYRLDDNGFWEPLGQTIESDLTTGSFGYSVSLNEDGTVLAVADPDDGSQTTGCVLVYELQDGQWERRGQNLDGGGPDQFAGGGVVLSDDGTVLLYDIFITARQPGPTKFVRVFRYNGSTWEKVGQDVYGQVATLTDAFCFDLTGDGTKFTIGATVPGFGYAETYQLNGNTWEKYGEIIPDPMTTDESVGLSVALDEDGNRLAVGFRKFQTSNIVRAYEFDDEWIQLGEDVDSKGSVSSTMMTTDYSSDGQTLAVGPQENTDFVSVHSYDLTTDTWSQFGDNIDAGLTTTGAQVQAVSLSDEGPRVAVFDLGGESAKVYDAPASATSRRLV